jgi:hypothetical protein
LWLPGGSVVVQNAFTLSAPIDPGWHAVGSMARLAPHVAWSTVLFLCRPPFRNFEGAIGRDMGVTKTSIPTRPARPYLHPGANRIIRPHYARFITLTSNPVAMLHKCAAGHLARKPSCN